MCGIGGCVVRNDLPPDAARLEAMRDAMSHRGPDSHGVVVIGNVGLVHTRLAIVDPIERSNQPMSTPDDKYWLTYNGEIFNHLSLRSGLRRQRFATASDTETLLHMLASRGEAAIGSLNGQFAFALLDLGRRRLLLARDRFGIKPLYISRQEDGLWFASEPHALIAAGVTPKLQPDAWEQILIGSCYSGRNTLHQCIERVSPGGLLSVALDSAQATQSVWRRATDDVDRDRQDDLALRSRRELTDQLEEALRSAVHDSLLGDVPVGTLCSGGLDSSLVTALAREVKPGLVAFGARYRGDPALDEGPAAKRAADALGVELDLLDVTESGWRSGFVSASLHFGAPLANASSVTVAQMAERARARGIRVLLTGEGADELFAGYAGLHADALPQVLSRRARVSRALEFTLFERPLHTIAFAGRRLLTQPKRRSPRGPIWETLTSGATDEAGTLATTSAYADHSDSARRLERDLLGRLDYTLSHLLNRMDMNMMQVSVEARVPFLDTRVVGLALNLPIAVRVGPWSKGLLRDVARRHLPLRSAHRPKIYGMDFDAGRWIERNADPTFLSEGVLRDEMKIPRANFARTLASAKGALKVRIWSAEVWARQLLANQSQPSIEQAIWPYGP